MSTEDLEEATLAEHIRRRTLRGSLGLVVDSLFFLVGTAAAGWLAYLVATESFARGWQQLWFLLVFWAVVAYLLLPRVHSILTLFYVPDYFIGRAKTREGLLGDPVNVALRGSEEQVHEAMVRAGWHRADDMGLRSALRTIRDTVLRRSYPDAPVSALYLFGRMQSFTYQQDAGNTSQRHHVRFWPCPPGWLLPGGVRADWMAAGTYDRAIGLSFFTLQLTHRVDRDTDRERDYIVETLAEGNESVRVETIRSFSSGYHHVNGGGDAITTDGDLPIVDVSRVPTWDVARTRDSAEDESSAINPLGTPVSERPQSVYLGVLLMALRVATAIVTAVVVAFSLPEAERSIRNLSGALTPEDAQYLTSLVLTAFVALLGVAIAFYSLLAYLIYHGHNWARFTAMGISAAAIVGAALNFWHGGPEITLQTNLVGLSFDVLVLLALSGTDARRFAHRRALERRALRARRRAARLTDPAPA